ncbi:MAG TPA: alkaline phosphatase family protein [Pyrinomonadaceae bacterium]|nr:alkaline phosphatase family protein [Pyrinomonadaceae bacterium]
MSNTQSTPIENIIVLMMENRSFDNILGALYPHSDQFEGLILDGSMSNTYNNEPYHVTNESSGDTFTTPTPDPGESFQDMNLQIFNNTDGSGPATMGGFINDWMAGVTTNYPGLPSGKECLWAPDWPSLPRCPDPKVPCPGPNPSDIMFYYTTSGSSPQLPVTGWLAQNFAVSDAWFGSSPTQTFPNRFFVNCATSGGYVQDLDYLCQLEVWPNFPSIFELLDGPGGPNPVNWKVYFHDYAISTMIKYVLEAYEQVRNFDTSDFGSETKTPTFFDDLNNHTLPKYSFIEPRYGGIDNLPPNSNHPPNNVLEGEILLATVYNAIAQSDYYWPRTLLMITYDEHGGCFDHVVPPAAIPPGGTVLRNPSTFGFDRYGPRVPAILVSPYIQAGTVLRPNGFAYNPVSNGITTTNSVTPFDHTSIIKTVCECFNIQGNLTQRDLDAPSLLPALTLSSANMNSPGLVPVPPPPAITVSNPTTHLSEIFHTIIKRLAEIY